MYICIYIYVCIYSCMNIIMLHVCKCIFMFIWYDSLFLYIIFKIKYNIIYYYNGLINHYHLFIYHILYSVKLRFYEKSSPLKQYCCLKVGMWNHITSIFTALNSFFSFVIELEQIPYSITNCMNRVPVIYPDLERVHAQLNFKSRLRIAGSSSRLCLRSTRALSLAFLS